MRCIHVKFGISTTIRSILIARNIIPHRVTVGCRPRNLTLDAEHIPSHFDVNVSGIAPVLTPRVANDPIRNTGFVVFAPSDDGNDVVDTLVKEAVIPDDSSVVLEDWFCVDASRDRSAGVYFCFYFVDIVVNVSVLGNGHVWKVVNLRTSSTSTGKSATRTTGINLATRGIHMLAEPLGRFLRASNVRLTRIKRNKASLLNEMVRSRSGATMAGTGNVTSAVEDELNGQVDVVSLALSGDFHTVGQRREGSVCPARSAVLGNVLV
mmetsp:Transcript_27737/g.40992  ORF Transcript_27737/g.40992 Transcript_27737/m.40992 type:complete len:265 (-) Transcript_27737:329-1123(-)